MSYAAAVTSCTRILEMRWHVVLFLVSSAALFWVYTARGFICSACRCIIAFQVLGSNTNWLRPRAQLLKLEKRIGNKWRAWLSHLSCVFSFLLERKLFTASPTASAMLPRPQRQLPRHTFHIYNPSASFRGLVFLVFASATIAPLRFPRFLVVVGFISFHFGLLGLHFLSFWPFSFATFVCLGLGHFLKASAGGTVVWACVPSAVLPRGFRKTPKQNR